MITIRPMAEGDVEPAVATWVAAFNSMRARTGRAVTDPTPSDLLRQQNRMRHLLRTDPDGSWVATSADDVVGLSQSFVREGYWVLALLGMAPGQQGQGVGRKLLDAAMAHGEGLPGTIQCSFDPTAMRLYQSSGFDLHPTVLAHGTLGPGTVAGGNGSRPGTQADLDLAATIDRATRGAARSVDLEHLLRQEGHRLTVHDDGAYAVIRDGGLVTMGALDPASATALLSDAIVEAGPGAIFEMGWITSPQQWAIGTALDAGLELLPAGPVMVRGMPGPPCPFLPNGGLG